MLLVHLAFFSGPMSLHQSEETSILIHTSLLPSPLPHASIQFPLPIYANCRYANPSLFFFCLFPEILDEISWSYYETDTNIFRWQQDTVTLVSWWQEGLGVALGQLKVTGPDGPSAPSRHHGPVCISSIYIFCGKGNLYMLQGYTNSPNGGIDWIWTPELYFVPFSSKLLCDLGIVVSTLCASPVLLPPLQIWAEMIPEFCKISGSHFQIETDVYESYFKFIKPTHISILRVYSTYSIFL